MCKKVIRLEEVQPNFALREAIEKYKESPAKNEDKETPPSHGCIFRELFADHALEATSVLYEAFKDDPWIVYFLPDKDRKTSLTWFLSLIVCKSTSHFLKSIFQHTVLSMDECGQLMMNTTKLEVPVSLSPLMNH